MDAVGQVLFRLLLPWLPREIVAIVDDTLCHKGGPHLFGAGVHHDGSRSAYGWLGGARRILSFGHKWVLLSVRVPCPWNPDRGWAVPILFRLYRNRKSSPGAEYKKRSQLAVDLLGILTAWLPEDRRLHLTGDRDYACQTVVRRLPTGVDITGPVPLDAALFKEARTLW